MTGSYLNDDRLVVVTYFRHGDAKAPSFAIDYQPNAGKIGNVSYQRITFRITPSGGDISGKDKVGASIR